MEMDKQGSGAGENTASIAWGEIRQRLKNAHAAIEQALSPGTDEVQKILQARAQALAHESQPAQTAGEHIEVVEFVLAQEHYAIESRYIRDVCPLEQLTPVPCTPPFVLGIIHLRGEILSVIDIKKFFDLPEKGLSDLNKVVVLASDNMYFGVLADAIVGAHQIPLADIQPSLPTLTGIRAEYLLGVTPGRTVVLDGEKLLTDGRIVVQEQVAGQSPWSAVSARGE